MKIVFAGGGSGGTISPGIAVAERLADLDSNVEILFLCSDRAIDQTMLADTPWQAIPMPAAPPVRSLLGGWRFVRGFHATRSLARGLLVSSTQTHVVSLGGFVAPPVIDAARRCGVARTLLNLDSVAGKANRWTAKRVSHVLTAVECDLAGAEGPFGVPLRRAVFGSDSREKLRLQWGIAPDHSVLLVTGASQGARSLNNFMEAFLAASPTALKGWHVIHLCGQQDTVARLEHAYRAVNVPARVVPFLSTMGEAWGVADLAMSRGGASSIAELHANNVPSIIAPYPWHADNHQLANAQPLLALGGAVIVEDQVDPTSNLAAIGPTLERLLADAAALAAMRDALARTAPVDAADAIAKRLLKLS
jgi:UDP-N-acetylglucosamine--N-acetylmuramyl-(pentapeptide) pyrophosphoryl-undecaprenol N-acetylglucosamine transferase